MRERQAGGVRVPGTGICVAPACCIMGIWLTARLTFTLGEALYLRCHRENGC